MTKNPFPEFVEDEASGVKVPNQRYQDWQAGYAAAFKDYLQILLNGIDRLKRLF
ncbi:MAG: hypothetical protein Q8O55_07330 [Dehalococcoidales bacterium]|nr:hypothetical protein [Dehalococcoidales bacterium]